MILNLEGRYPAYGLSDSVVPDQPLRGGLFDMSSIFARMEEWPSSISKNAEAARLAHELAAKPHLLTAAVADALRVRLADVRRRRSPNRPR